MGMSSDLGAPQTGNLGSMSEDFLRVVPLSQVGALLLGLVTPLVDAVKTQTAGIAALEKKVDALMTNQQALDAQDAILAADVATLTQTTQNVVTALATLNNSNAALTAEVASLQAANPALDFTKLVNATNGVSAANALLLSAVAPLTTPPVVAAPPTTAPTTAPAPAA